MRRLGDALDRARVLLREKAFGHDDVEQYGQHQGPKRDQQGQRLMLEHERERAAVPRDHRLPDTFAGREHAALIRCRLMAQQLRAQHRREGERDHGRNQDRHRQRDRELSKQPADHVAHEQQRNQDRNQ